MAKKIFISDVHIGAGRIPNKENGCNYRYDWLSQPEAKDFCAFLDYLNAKAGDLDIEEVILLGDIFDNWICPVHEEPPTIGDIISNNKDPVNKAIIESLKQLANNNSITNILYVRGNHDMEIKQADLDLISEKIKLQETYEQNGIYAAHGNAYDSYNKKNIKPTQDSLNNPLGYFISRIVATGDAKIRPNARNSVKLWMRRMEEAIKILQKKVPSAEVIFNICLKEAGLNRETQVLVPIENATERSVKIGDVIANYKGVNIPWSIIDLSQSALGWYNQLTQKGTEVKVIIFGHTHKAELETIPVGLPLRPGEALQAIYANCGSWCEDSDLTCIETEEKGGYHFVRLRTWTGDKLDDTFQELKIS